jgi:hypothetical protein
MEKNIRKRKFSHYYCEKVRTSVNNSQISPQQMKAKVPKNVNAKLPVFQCTLVHRFFVCARSGDLMEKISVEQPV